MLNRATCCKIRLAERILSAFRLLKCCVTTTVTVQLTELHHYINPFKDGRTKKHVSLSRLMWKMSRRFGKKGEVSTGAFECLSPISLFQVSLDMQTRVRLIERVRTGDWNPMTRQQIKHSWGEVLLLWAVSCRSHRHKETVELLSDPVIWWKLTGTICDSRVVNKRGGLTQI